MKKVIAACIDQVLQFSSKAEYEKFIKSLEDKKQRFKITFQQFSEKGTVEIRIKRPYNNSPMMD